MTEPAADSPSSPPLRIGIDPGSAHVGLVATLGAEPPLTLLHREVLDVGHHVELPAPRTGTRRNGQAWTQTHRRVVDGDDVADLCDRVLARCLEICAGAGVEPPDAIVITEHVENVFLPEDKPGAHRAIATAIQRSAWIAGEIRATLRAAGFKQIRKTQQASSRAKVCGRDPEKRGGSASGERIKAAVRARILDWPERTVDHERDAAVLCLWDAMPAPAPGKRKRRRTAEGAATAGAPPQTATGVSPTASPRRRAPAAPPRPEVACTCGRDPTLRGRHPLPCAKATAAKRTAARTGPSREVKRILEMARWVG